MDNITSNPRAVVFTTKMRSFNHEKSRWYLPVPKTVAQLIDKNKVILVTLRPIGSIG